MGMFRGRWAWSLTIALLAPALGSAQQPAAAPGKLVQDVWETAYLDGCRVGYMHLSVEEHTRADGKKVLHAAREMDLKVRRGPDVARIQAMTGTDETPDGTVLGVFMRQGLAAQVTQEVVGKVDGRLLHLQARGGQGNFKKDIPWDPRAIGTLGEENVLKNRKPKPGDKFDYRLFEPIVNAIVTVRVAVEDFEQVPFGNQKRKLLRATAVPDEIDGVQLPGQILWVDDEYNLLRSTTVMPGLGFLLVDRTTREDALRPVDTNQVPDIMERQSIKLRERVS